MDISQFTEIVAAANTEQIETRLKELGYTCCNNDRKLGKVGIVELVNAVNFETEDFTDADRKHLYNGRICRTVKGYENYEFVYINVFEINRRQTRSTTKKRQYRPKCSFGRRRYNIWLISIAVTVLTVNTQTTSLSVGAATGIRSCT